MPGRGRDPFGCGDRTQFARCHQQTEINLGQSFGNALVDPARQVHDHHSAQATRGGEHSPHRLRRNHHLVVTAPAQHPQSVQRGQRILQGPAAETSLRLGEIRPPHALGPLAAEQHIDAASQRVGVDQHRALARSRRTHRECAGQRGRAGAAPAAQHADGQRRPPHAFGGVGDLFDEPALGIRQPQHILGPDLHRPPPHVRVFLVPPDQHHPLPSASATPSGRIVPNQHHRSPLPATTPPRWSVMDLGFGARRRAQPQQVVEQLHVLRHDQRASAPPPGDRHTISCEGSSHDLRPLLTVPSVRFAVFSERFRDARSSNRGLRGWNQREARRKKMWILMKNCGQPRACE